MRASRDATSPGAPYLLEVSSSLDGVLRTRVHCILQEYYVVNHVARNETPRV